MSKRISVADIETPSTKFEEWLVALDKELKELQMKRFPSLEWKPMEYSKGRKYAKIIHDNSVWAFVAMQDVNTKNKSFKKGDLLFPAGWSAPAKHPRGNIFDGTARYNAYGPAYFK